MTKWAESRRKFLKNPSVEWKDDWYIRVGGNGYTAVSLNDKRPLLGFSSGTVTNLETVMHHFNKPTKESGRKTPEKRAQAWLIKQALKNNLNLKTCLGLEGSIYEELLFALDEVSFGDRDNQPIRRLDILAVGIHDGSGFPVFIELKSRREAGRLQNQLRQYQSQIKPYKPEFERLLSACTNRKLDLSKYGSIIVWPRSKRGSTSDMAQAECSQHKVTIIESDTYTWEGARDFSFKPSGEVYLPIPYIGES